jgi:hypothetical protein
MGDAGTQAVSPDGDVVDLQQGGFSLVTEARGDSGA